MRACRILCFVRRGNEVSESEITEQMVMMMDLTLAGVSVLFSIVSAYIVALYFFLREAPFGLRMIAFLLFSLTFAFLCIFAANCFSHSASLQAALVELGQTETLSSVGRAAIKPGMIDRAALDHTIQVITWSGMALFYLALTYFTFLHNWRDHVPLLKPVRKSG